jgi:hypothetical protein
MIFFLTINSREIIKFNKKKIAKIRFDIILGVTLFGLSAEID